MPAAVRFEPQDGDGEAVRAIAKPGTTYFALAPAGGVGSSTAPHVDALSELLARARVDQLPQPPPTPDTADPRPRPPTAGGKAAYLHGPGALGPSGPIAQALAEAARDAAAHTPRFSAVKLRFHLGKQLFFAPPSPDDVPVPLERLQGLGERCRGPVPVFSNVVPGAHVEPLVAWLTQGLGFTELPGKTAATVHVVNERLNVHYAIGLTFNEEGRVALSKVKSAATRCHYMALLGGPRELDLRLKLIAQVEDLRVDHAVQAAEAVVAACNAGGMAAFMGAAGDGADVDLPPDMRQDVGSGPPVGLKVSVKTVQQGRQWGRKGGGEAAPEDLPRHVEVTGTLPYMDEQLAALLQAAAGGEGAGSGAGAAVGAGAAGGGSPCGPAWAGGVLRAVVAFAEAVNVALA
ncbi:hypothetical protein HYH03_000268 [Edaphochlamys debaryana]|uniref:Uncharacterized protein n=1 Tax=Edaphochlamys debaryana TaxID=47281 RepID=A0A835YFI0_9CHLO|nr:hypothetical protein HYH03_000268 [Edaphochlamys debaryana]|eukprot:KAG2501768.1 hypothetical protein HYH03_000268 [Edaphochlamys debaryana]